MIGAKVRAAWNAKKPPIQVIVAIAATVALAAVDAIVGWANSGLPLDPWVTWNQPIPSAALGLMVLAPIAHLCGAMMFMRKRNLPTVTVAVVALSLGLIQHIHAAIDPDAYTDRLLADVPRFRIVIDELLGTASVWLSLAASLAVFVGLCGLLYSKASVDWFGLRASDAKYRSRFQKAGLVHWPQIIRVVALSALAWWLLQYVQIGQALASAIPSSMPETTLTDHLFELLSWIDLVLPFLAACAILIWSGGEGLTVDSRGIRLILPAAGLNVFGAPWQRIRRIDFVNHRTRARSAVIHYRGWFGVPLSFTVHAKRYAEGAYAIDDIRTEARRREVESTDWFSPDEAPLAATLLVAVGVLIGVYLLYLQSASWSLFVNDKIPLNRFHEIAAPIPQALLHICAAACFGAALGVLSAFHQAGSRPFLLIVWLLVGVSLIPSPWIHWLVWMAIYSILIARAAQSPQDTVSLPALSQMEAGMDLVNLAPLISGLAYVLGLVLACRRVSRRPEAR